MSKQMNMLKKMQDAMTKIQAELEHKTAEGTSGGGAVTVVINGHLKVMSITLNDEILEEPDKEMLEDLITAAVNNGIDKAQEMIQQEMSKITGGLPIPNLF